MKKKLLALLVALFSVVSAAAFVACDKEKNDAPQNDVSEGVSTEMSSDEDTVENTDSSGDDTDSSGDDTDSSGDDADSSGDDTDSSEVHTHTFAGTWSKDSTGHWYAANCGHDETKDKAAHTYNNEGVCSVCEWTIHNIAEAEFAAAILLENVNNFTYDREWEGTLVSKVDTQETFTYPAVGEEKFISSGAKGYSSYVGTSGTAENRVHHISFEGGSPTADLQGFESPIAKVEEMYFEVEEGKEYVLRYYPVSMTTSAWKKFNFDDVFLGGGTYNAYIHSELSMFQEAAKKYQAFTFDTTSKTYKNKQPMSFSDVDDVMPEEGVTTVKYTNMYYEFKIGEGVVEWMQLTCDYEITDTYDIDTYPQNIYIYHNALLQGKLLGDVQTGTMTVKYYNINKSVVDNFPTEYILDSNVNNGCAHAALKEVEGFEDTHRQCCEDCRAIVVWESHDYENGRCIDCGHACAHEYVNSSYCSAVDNQKHEAFCLGCGEFVLVNHNYDANEYCPDCEYTYCAHEGQPDPTRLNNEEHGFYCTNCELMLREAHSYNGEEICTVCGAEYCEHSNLGVYEYNKTSKTHDRYCFDCSDQFSEAHTFVNEVCTVCNYAACHHENKTNMMITYDIHIYNCEDCLEINIGEEHTLQEGVCTVCGYDDNCAHETSEYANYEYTHAKTCTQCGYMTDVTESCTWDADGVCTKCHTACEHIYIEGICYMCRKECSHVNRGESGLCPDCWLYQEG